MTQQSQALDEKALEAAFRVNHHPDAEPSSVEKAQLSRSISAYLAALGGIPANQGEAGASKLRIWDAIQSRYWEWKNSLDASKNEDAMLCDLALAAFFAALSQHPVAVAVKPLEWEPNGDPEVWNAAGSIIGTYFAYSNRWRLESCEAEYHPDLKTAKAAAQAHYETTIRSALIASPVPAKADGGVTEAMVEQALEVWFGKDKPWHAGLANSVVDDCRLQMRATLKAALQQDQRS